MSKDVPLWVGSGPLVASAVHGRQTPLPVVKTEPCRRSCGQILLLPTGEYALAELRLGGASQAQHAPSESRDDPIAADYKGALCKPIERSPPKRA